MNKLVIIALIVCLGFSLKSHQKARFIRKAHNMLETHNIQEAHGIQEAHLLDEVACRKQNGTVCGFFTKDCCVKGCVSSMFSGETCQDEKFININQTPISNKTANVSINTTGAPKTNSTSNQFNQTAYRSLSDKKRYESQDAFPQYSSDKNIYQNTHPQFFRNLAFGNDVSSSSMEEYKSFLKDNKSYITYKLVNFYTDKTPLCMKKLTDDQKRKLIIIGIDNRDFIHDLSPSASKDLFKKMSDDIQNDPSLGKNVALCFTQNSSNFSLFF